MIIQMREDTAVIVRDARDELKGDEGSTNGEWLRRSYIAWKMAIIEDEVFGAAGFWCVVTIPMRSWLLIIRDAGGRLWEPCLMLCGP
jgi:hypothetical protein